jgi:hypothetical protein
MREDDLTPLERQLSAFCPAAAGLDSDAMLFAAGQATAARTAGRRWAWPLATCGFAVVSLTLAAALVGERSERLALAARLERQSIAMVSPPTVSPPEPALPPADSYIAARHWIESGADNDFVRTDPKPPPPSPPDDPPVLRASSTDIDP